MGISKTIRNVIAFTEEMNCYYFSDYNKAMKEIKG